MHGTRARLERMGPQAVAAGARRRAAHAPRARRPRRLPTRPGRLP